MLRLEPALIVIGLALVAGTKSYADAAASKAREARPLENTPQVERFIHSTVTIQRASALGNKTSVGAGVFIKADYGHPAWILTASHVVEALNGSVGYIKVYNGTPQGIPLRVRILDVNDDYDLAVLATEDAWRGKAVAVQVASMPPKRGEQVLAIGAPNGIDWNVSSGVISNQTPCANSVGACYRTDATLTFGNSGGGVFNAKSELVGIAAYVRIDQVTDARGAVHSIVVDGNNGVVALDTLRTYMSTLRASTQ